MCIICVELIKQKMTIPEAERNVGEKIISTKYWERLEHEIELAKALKELDIDKLDKILDEGLKSESVR